MTRLLASRGLTVTNSVLPLDTANVPIAAYVTTGAPGTYGRISPRSSLALHHGIDVLAGVIDKDYRGRERDNQLKYPSWAHQYLKRRPVDLARGTRKVKRKRPLVRRQPVQPRFLSDEATYQSSPITIDSPEKEEGWVEGESYFVPRSESDEIETGSLDLIGNIAGKYLSPYVHRRVFTDPSIRLEHDRWEVGLAELSYPVGLESHEDNILPKDKELMTNVVVTHVGRISFPQHEFSSFKSDAKLLHESPGISPVTREQAR
uniref:dUTP diphosphatase n=1 Tax=Timema cristinae TaxID=61476 RepID=A0A7R9CKC1_TIMCR|nr:unnamed protein product [Timema cristinae]